MLESPLRIGRQGHRFDLRSRRNREKAPAVNYPGMRKQIFTPTPQGIRPQDEGWLDLDRVASVEVTSEEKDYGNPKQSERKSSSCDGLQMAGTHFEKLCASGGISAHLTQYARSKNIGLNSPMSRFLNWSLCLTSVEERLAPRSRVCACLDLLWRCSLSRKLRRTTISL